MHLILVFAQHRAGGSALLRYPGKRYRCCPVKHSLRRQHGKCVHVECLCFYRNGLSVAEFNSVGGWPFYLDSRSYIDLSRHRSVNNRHYMVQCDRYLHQQLPERSIFSWGNGFTLHKHLQRYPRANIHCSGHTNYLRLKQCDHESFNHLHCYRYFLPVG